MSLPNSLKSRVIWVTHLPSRRISAKESRYSRGLVKAPSHSDKARDREVHWSCSPGHYNNHPISTNSSFKYRSHIMHSVLNNVLVLVVFRSSLQLVRLSSLDGALRKLGAFSDYEDGWFCYSTPREESLSLSPGVPLCR